MSKENIRKYSDKELYKKLFTYLRPVLFKFILALFLVLIIVLLDLLPSFLTGEVINILNNESKYFSSYTGSTLNLIGLLVLSYLGVLILSLFINYFYQHLLQNIGQNMIYEVRSDTFNHIEALSIEQINKEPIGRLVTRVTNDTNALSELFTSVLVLLIRYLLTIIIIYIVMFATSVKLTALISIVVPIILIASIIFRRTSRKSYRNVRNALSTMNSYLSENISGMKVTQIFNQEDKKLKEFKEKNNELKNANLKQIFIFSIFRPLMYFLFVVCIVITLYFGAIEVNNQNLLVGSLVTYYGLVNKFFNPIENLAEQFNQLQSALASSEKIFTLLDTSPTIVENIDAKDIQKIKGKIEFKHVYFAYTKDNWILEDVSFVVEAGS